MYKIFVGHVDDNECIFDDTDCAYSYERVLIDPVLTMEDNAAGTLEFTLPSSNIGYDWVTRMGTAITVFRGDDELWSSRVLTEEGDFFNNRRIVCEGELAYLNDTIQPQAEYHDITVRQFLETLLNNHNSKVGLDKQFIVGIVTVTDSNDSLYRYTNYENTMECINDKLISRLGGHLRIRKENGNRYLDYLKDYPNTNSQVIRFGENLLDFAKSFDLSDIATVILPLGAPLQESPIEALQAYLDVSSVNNGSLYVKSTDAVNRYGWIAKVVRWDDVEDASNLLRKANEYLSEVQFEEMQLEVSALDLSYVNVNAEYIKMLDKIRVISEPHGLNRLFPVTKLKIPLDNPENAVYELGTSVRLTLTKAHNSANAEILGRMENLPTQSSMLRAAKENATALIRNATNGYVTILTDNDRTQEILITDESDYTDAERVWRWNVNGLGYSSTGYDGEYGLAMTMDGAIVADYVTTGTLSADRIRGGQLTLGGIDDENGVYVLKDGSGRPTILMNNAGAVMMSQSRYYMRLNANGQITGGVYSGRIGNDYLSEMFDENNYTQYGIIDSAAELYDIPEDRTLRGLRIKSNLIHLVAERISVIDSMADDAVSLSTVKHADIPYIASVTPHQDGTASFETRYLGVVNGLVVSY